LESLRITKEYTSDENRTTKPEILEKIFIAPVLAKMEQLVILKSIVSDSEWFDGDQMKFKDW